MSDSQSEASKKVVEIRDADPVEEKGAFTRQRENAPR
jgi:hypothetical protein